MNFHFSLTFCWTYFCAQISELRPTFGPNIQLEYCSDLIILFTVEGILQTGRYAEVVCYTEVIAIGGFTVLY